MTRPQRRRVVVWPWYLVLWTGLALIVLAQLGHDLGWWRDWGDWVNVLGLVLAGSALPYTASASAVRQLGDRLDGIDDRLATIDTVLEHQILPTLQAILRVLEDRLPPRA